MNVIKPILKRKSSVLTEDDISYGVFPQDVLEYMVFMMVNTSKSNKQHQRKKTRETILREERNSMIEEQFEEPQHLEQSKRVLRHKACS